MSVKDLSAY